jgi:hypothetical protein
LKDAWALEYAWALEDGREAVGALVLQDAWALEDGGGVVADLDVVKVLGEWLEVELESEEYVRSIGTALR